ncbi:MAG: 23S rRNA (uracil(1939)-C(5))-methyltransferase RlmD [Planctomycetes bacterium]|nr:23S rRNA (uracil(1939)-C(5))-methyltransferase RlmD [Planctomycetota bacterium]
MNQLGTHPGTQQAPQPAPQPANAWRPAGADERGLPGAPSSERKPRRGDRLIARLEGFDERGRARGKAQAASGAYSVELARGVPGDEVEIEVLGRRRQALHARILGWRSAAPARVAPRCAHAGTCGGCSFQDCAYDAQLAAKSRLLSRTLERAGLDPRSFDLRAIEPAPRTFGFRAKMDFTFSSRRFVLADEPQNASADFALGLHPRDFHGKVIDVGRCEIQFERANRILATVRELCRAHGFEPWDVVRHTGFVRHLVLRESRATGEILANLVTSSESPERMAPFARELAARLECVTTFVQNVHSKPAQAALSEREIVHHGPGFVRERLGAIEFRLSARSFFQTNVAQAERLLEVVLEELAAPSDATVADLYCGTGAFALNVARRVRAVRGYELVESAIADARATATANGVTNASFVAGDLARTLAEDSPTAPITSSALAAPAAPATLATLANPANSAPDAPPPARATHVIADPPRAGLHPKTLAALIALAPERIVLVACHAPSGARDAAGLVAAGWRLERVRPLDFFPHGPHLETVFTLSRTP